MFLFIFLLRAVDRIQAIVKRGPKLPTKPKKRGTKLPTKHVHLGCSRPFMAAFCHVVSAPGSDRSILITAIFISSTITGDNTGSCESALPAVRWRTEKEAPAAGAEQNGGASGLTGDVFQLDMVSPPKMPVLLKYICQKMARFQYFVPSSPPPPNVKHHNKA